MSTIFVELALGVAMPRQLLLVPRQRGCLHPQTAAPFCGVCGKSTWIQPNELVEVDSFGLEIFHDNTTNFHDVDESRPVILGLLIDTTKPLDPAQPLPPDAVERTRAALAQVIAAYHLPLDPATLDLRLFLARYLC